MSALGQKRTLDMSLLVAQIRTFIGQTQRLLWAKDNFIDFLLGGRGVRRLDYGPIVYEKESADHGYLISAGFSLSTKDPEEQTMGLLDDAVPQGSVSKPLMIALGALLASGALYKHASSGSQPSKPATQQPSDQSGDVAGGLGGLLDQFQQSGLGNIMKSWIGTGPNQPVSPNQVGSALGPNIIKVLAQKTGMSEQELTAQLSQILPGVVDKLTPNGRLPS